MKKQSAILPLRPFLILAAATVGAIPAALPTGVTVVPFYDVNKAGLSFKKDQQSVVGMWEVPGKPKHFLVLGFWGYVWSLYPDTAKTYAPGAIKDYTKAQLADFNSMVMKGWEQGALGAAFDPDFAANHYFYIIYNRYANASDYHGGVKPTSADGFNVSGLVVVERWKLSADFHSLARDTTIFTATHGTGPGSSNIVFGKDSLLYITTDSYSQNSWDSTIFMRKILRIDVSRRDPGKLYAIPPSNPFYNATNPAVKKEIYAFGFRNTYSLQADYITGHIWGGEVGQITWEEVNIIQPGKNYGWANGGDFAVVGNNSIGIEGPCSPTGGAFTSSGSDSGNTSSGSLMADYSRAYKGRTYTCADFANATWNFSHSGSDLNGSKTALPGTPINCIIVSQAFRGDPGSPFYGYHFVTDVASDYFIAVKEGIAAPEKVGGIPGDWVFTGDRTHDGITSFSEDSYGNMYVTLLSSSSGGAFDWHDIYMLSHPQMKPLAVPRGQVFPTSVSGSLAKATLAGRFHSLVVSAGGHPVWIRLPEGFTRAEVYNLGGKRVWSGKADLRIGRDAGLALPSKIETGTLGVRFLP